jgi:hypothetical protein
MAERTTWFPGVAVMVLEAVGEAALLGYLSQQAEWSRQRRRSSTTRFLGVEGQANGVVPGCFNIEK